MLFLNLLESIIKNDFKGYNRLFKIELKREFKQNIHFELILYNDYKIRCCYNTMYNAFEYCYFNPYIEEDGSNYFRFDDSEESLDLNDDENCINIVGKMFYRYIEENPSYYEFLKLGGICV